jgi:hypothetical protein
MHIDFFTFFGCLWENNIVFINVFLLGEIPVRLSLIYGILIFLAHDKCCWSNLYENGNCSMIARRSWWDVSKFSEWMDSWMESPNYLSICIWYVSFVSLELWLGSTLGVQFLHQLQTILHVHMLTYATSNCLAPFAQLTVMHI